MMLDEIELRKRREEFLKKFHTKFLLEHYNKDAMFRVVLEKLMWNTDPYKIIEMLLIDREKLIEEFTEYAKKTTLLKTSTMGI